MRRLQVEGFDGGRVERCVEIDAHDDTVVRVVRGADVRHQVGVPVWYASQCRQGMHGGVLRTSDLESYTRHVQYTHTRAHARAAARARAPTHLLFSPPSKIPWNPLRLFEIDVRSM